MIAMNKYVLGLVLLMVGVLPAASQVSNDNEDGVNKLNTRHGAQDFVPGQVLVKFKDDHRLTVNRTRGKFASTNADNVTGILHKYGTDEIEQLLPNEKPNRKLRRSRAYNGDVIQERDLSQLYCLKLSADHRHETMQMIKELKDLDEVEYAEPNYRVYMMGGESIAANYGTNPMVSKQWYLDAYGVTALWNKPIVNSERPVIAIIDTGVDTEHPDLKENCIEGYDFVNNTSQVTDDNMHGTHVAGIAAACHNETGIVGANPQALIMPVKVLDRNGAGDNATVLRGVAYAVEHGAKILNLSLGGYGYSKAAADVYRNASLSAIIVAAAGNDGKCIYASHEGMQKHGILPAPSFPGAYSYVLGVQATNRKGELASFSNYDDDGPLFSCEASLDEPDGFNYEIKAPGTEIFSTLPGGNYGELQGTSMASPLVAGAISALMMVKQYDTQEQLWAELLHTNNIAEAYELTEMPADLDVVRIMLRERKEFSDEMEGDYLGNNEVKAGETINIYPVIRCTSGDASNIIIKIGVDENEDPNAVQIITGETDFGWHLDAMGKAVSKNPLTVKIPEDIVDSRHIRMMITVSCDNQYGSNSRQFIFIANNMETISGILSKNTTLYKGHTYYVDDVLYVNEGVTLTIEPGARLEFAKEKYLISDGKLIAKGTIEEPIIFTSHHGGERWNGIKTRKKKTDGIRKGLYTNNEQTLFTLLKTESTPVFISDNFSKWGWFDRNSGYGTKSFSLEDYVEGWNIYNDLLDNVHGDESLLTDPNFLTSTVLKMLRDFNEYIDKYITEVKTETNTGYGEVTANLLRWTQYSDYGDTIAYCRIDDCYLGDYYDHDCPFMDNCLIEHSDNPSMDGVCCVVTENDFVYNLRKNKYFNIINNDGASYSYSRLTDSNFFNTNNEYWLKIDTQEPEIDHSNNPAYLGTSREDIVRPHVYELGNVSTGTWGTIDLSNMRTTPVTEAHGMIWKILVNGKDAQDEYEELAPLGVGRHKFEVYFNRPMNKNVVPLISFGVRFPWTQISVDENCSWNNEGTIYTAYKTITGKMSSDGVNRIYVRGAEDEEHFPCPYERTRFNINVQVAGSMATGFAAEASVGRVNLTWNNENNDFEDAMGFNVYRFCNDVKKTIPGHFDENWHWIEPVEVVDTIRINEKILDVETCEYTDYNVEPNHTYYYLYKVLSTDLKEYDVSNIVAATPKTSTFGDANGSGDVDVADVVTTVNYIIGKKPEPFIKDAADMNEDSNIDVLDVIGIVQKVLHPNNSRTRSTTEGSNAVYTIEDGVLYVESSVELGGVQVQVAFDEHQSVKNTNSLNGFEQSSTWLTDTDYLMLTYSLKGKSLAPGKHAILHIGNGKISSLHISDVNGYKVNTTRGEATNIESTIGSRVLRNNGVYNLKGQKVASSESEMKNLKSGVYIVNGMKVVK